MNKPSCVLAFALIACAPAKPPGAPAPLAASAPGGAPGPNLPAGSAGAAASAAGASASPSLLPRQPEIVLDPKAPARPLPELKVENVGLHIGGGPNDAETKAPFLRAVAERFPQFMDCYRQNEDPPKGGTFGIDLHVARGGGKPEVSQPRTGMRGPEFRACVVHVFESVEFDKPKRGPTVLSYSLKYSMSDG